MSCELDMDTWSKSYGVVPLTVIDSNPVRMEAWPSWLALHASG